MFFGREEELRDLQALWGKRGSSLVTCRGRRRIGKSTLIEEFARKSKARFIKVEGLRPRAGYDNQTELVAFMEQLSAKYKADGADVTWAMPASWLRAFMILNGLIRDGGRTVVLLDEVSWLGHYDETFADMAKIAWDDYWSHHDRLIVVLCGSVSGWIRERFVDNGAFFGRRSLDLVVRELPLRECVKFWGAAAKRIESREIVDILSVTGGVPRYLKEINTALSAAENIRRLAFRPKSVLREDFDEMFSDVITRLPTLSGKVVRALVGNGLTLTELSEVLAMEKGGRLTEALAQLEDAGLIAANLAKNPLTGMQAREKRYRLSDNYARFYLRYIEPSKSVIDAGSYSFVALDGLDGWDSVMGLQFENLVVNNYAALIAPLRLGNALIESAAPYRRICENTARGVQIDFLIQTQRNNYIVEIKRKREIGREIIREMEDKVRAFGTPHGRSVRTVLVYDGHLAPIVETEGYFDALVAFHELLGI